MAGYGPYISKITLPNGVSYDIKDQEARDLIASIVAGGLTFVVSADASNTPAGITWEKDGTTITGQLAASSDTKAYIYLVPHEKTGTTVDYYREYVTVNFGTEQSPVWAWEYLGNTDIDLSDLGDLAYKDSASGTVTFTTADSGSFTNGTVNTSATYTPAGSVSVTLSQTSTQASVVYGDYTPEGTISKPAITVTPSTSSFSVMSTAGSVTGGTSAAFTQGTDQFTAPTWTASVPETGGVSTENLVFSWAAGSFQQGSDTFTANTPTNVTLPTFQNATVMTGASAALASAPTFTGSTAASIIATQVSYDKATVQGTDFTGSQATIQATGTASGDVTLTKTAKTETVTVS